jgi:hypothetical protein
VIIEKNELRIVQIHFYSGKEILVKVGGSDGFVKNIGGRRVPFEIDADEQLIGCQLHHGIDEDGDNFFRGVTWIKCKVAY